MTGLDPDYHFDANDDEAWSEGGPLAVIAAIVVVLLIVAIGMVVDARRPDRVDPARFPPSTHGSR